MFIELITGKDIGSKTTYNLKKAISFEKVYCKFRSIFEIHFRFFEKEDFMHSPCLLFSNLSSMNKYYKDLIINLNKN